MTRIEGYQNSGASMTHPLPSQGAIARYGSNLGMTIFRFVGSATTEGGDRRPSPPAAPPRCYSVGPFSFFPTSGGKNQVLLAIRSEFPPRMRGVVMLTSVFEARKRWRFGGALKACAYGYPC